ncbi:MAG: patatin-like phospholipase family protein [Myxococcales bacterium]|nr:patatin-like phospholipase family protein [Myxococcales bacterium]
MTTTHHDWLAAAPYTLALGAGFFGFFAHTGVLRALEESGAARPRRVVGVSAGALAGGLWASGLGAAELEATLVALRRPDFWDPGLPLGGLLRGDKFAALLHGLLDARGVSTVEQCPTPFATVVYELAGRRTRVLERGRLAPAIQASCTVPLMFRPVRHEGRLLVDGGVGDRDGDTALAPDERVLQHRLISRSPWSRFSGGKPGLADMSERPGKKVMRIDTLPRVSPFRLEWGPRALATAREATLRWLEAPA